MAAARFGDLSLRLGSGLVLAGVGLGAVWAGGTVFAALCALLAGLMIWELVSLLSPHARRRLPVVLAAVGAALVLVAPDLPPPWDVLDLLVISTLAVLLPSGQRRVFALAAVQTLGVAAVTSMTDRLFGFLPNLIGASVTALLGTLLARFVGSVTTSAAIAAGISSGPRIGFAVQLLGLGLVAAVTLEQLGLATNILVVPLTAALTVGGLAVGLALALGARPVITHILAGHFLKQSLPRDTFIEIDGERGVVERVGAVDTLLRNGDKRWSVPNAYLMERVIKR